MDRPSNSHAERSSAYIILAEKPEGRRPLGKQRRRWVNNIKLDFGETGWGYLG
jgi:hypothetical protein